MLTFSTTILQFAQQGEKTGWTYIEVTADIAEQLLPGNKKSFRVKGKLDDYVFDGIALLPMGGGNFIMALNADIRKKIRKQKGAVLKVQIAVDEKPFQPSTDFIACLEDEPLAVAHFKTLAKSHQNYFSKWIEGAKTEPTKEKRIAQAVSALSKKMGYPEMLRMQKANRVDF